MSNHIFLWLLQALEEEYGAVSQERVARAIGVTQPTISNWKNGGEPNKTNLKRLLEFFRAHDAATLVRPLLEFQPIEPIRSKNEWRFSSDPNTVRQLKERLDHRRGIYVLYDSSGHAVYLGKTESSLYAEAKQRLKASPNRAVYKPVKSSKPQIGEVVRFLSAFEVANLAAIRNIEAFMLRAFPNDIRNKNRGEFKKLL